MGAARFVDVSHTVEHGMVTYQGLPAPLICDYLSRAASRARYAPGTEFQIGRIDMVANTGTYGTAGIAGQGGVGVGTGIQGNPGAVGATGEVVDLN